MNDQILLEELRRAAQAEPGRRQGYEALEALAKGEITTEERRLLEARAARSPEWARAVAAHTPPSPAENAALVEHLLTVIDGDQTAPRRAGVRPLHRAWRRGLVVSAAAVAALVSIVWPRPLPVYRVSNPTDVPCEQGTYRATSSSSARPPSLPVTQHCRAWVLRPESADRGGLEVRVVANDDPLHPIELRSVGRLENGVTSVVMNVTELARLRTNRQLGPEPDRLTFLLGRPQDPLPKVLGNAVPKQRLEARFALEP